MVTGIVDEYGRPLVRVRVVHPTSGANLEIDAIVDTGCTGSMSLTIDQIRRLGLPRAGQVNGELADGTVVPIPLHLCQVDWLGQLRLIETLGAGTRFALIGLGLLEDLILTIDYPARTVNLTPSPSLH